MDRLKELRKNYTDEEIIDMVENEYECVYDKYDMLTELCKNDEDDRFLMIPRFFIYNLRNHLVKAESNNGLSNTLSNEIVEFINSQESNDNENRGTYIASSTDVKNWINYLQIARKEIEMELKKDNPMYYRNRITELISQALENDLGVDVSLVDNTLSLTFIADNGDKAQFTLISAQRKEN